MNSRLPLTGQSGRFAAAGFTLLEVVIAVAIMAIALVVLLGSQATSLGRAGEASFHHLAPLLAANKLAELGAGVVPVADGEGDFAPDRPDFRWRLTIDEPEADGRQVLPELRAAVRRIEIVVTRKGAPWSYSLITAIPRNQAAMGGQEGR